ncbi:MAG: hypothetical protein NUV57_05495 [archaeon]|nr:hypothetical protein [archaeon]
MSDTITIPKKEYLDLKRKARAFEKEMEEVILVNKGIEAEMGKIRSGKTKTFTHEEVKKKFSL